MSESKEDEIEEAAGKLFMQILLVMILLRRLNLKTLESKCIKIIQQMKKNLLAVNQS